MIKRIKVIIRTIILFSLAILLGLFLWERKENNSLRAERYQLREKLRRKELQKKINEAPRKETKIWHRKTTTGSQASRKLARQAMPQDCRPCFENYQYQVEVKDEAGYWIFQDDNIFDQKPGNLTLTEKFWQAVPAPPPAEKNSSPQAKPLKNRILIGAELDQYKIEYSYSPLGLQTNKLNLNLSLYSSLTMSYTSAPIEARTGLGLEIRF